MNAHSPIRALAGGLAALLGLTVCSLAHAQVGPSSQNVKKPAPKKAVKPRRAAPSPPQVRVRTVVNRPKRPKRAPVVARVKPPTPRPTKPPVATAVRVKPPIRVPGPDAADIARRTAQREAQRQAELARVAAEKEVVLAALRLKAATDWQAQELSALQLLAELGAQASAPNLTAVVGPDVPPAPSGGGTIHRQKVTLIFMREDGQPFDATLVRRAPGPLTVSQSGNRLELEGPRLTGSDAELQFALPADWGFVKADDGRLSLGDYPGQETRSPLPASGGPRPMVAAASAPLFPNAQAEEAARAAVQAVEHPTAPAGAYPRPGGAMVAALIRLVEARRVLDLIRPVAPTSSAAARMEAWQNAERSRRLLDDVSLSLVEAGTALEKFSPAPVRTVLKEDYRIDYAILRNVLSHAAAREAQYRAEAAWAQSEALNPAAPDRGPSIRILEQSGAPGLGPQLTRYRDVADREKRYRDWARTAANGGPPAQVQVTRHLTRSVTIQRSYVDIRFAEADLRVEDRVTLGGDPVELTLSGGFWRGRIARARLTGNDRLRVARKTFTSELQGDLPLPRLDPYLADGNVLRAPEMRSLGVRTVAVTAGTAEEVTLFRELTPLQLRELRRDSDEAKAKDGVWLVHRSIPLALFLRPSGGEGTASERGAKGRSDRWVVSGARLDGPTAGQVGGLRVGSTVRAVESVFGTTVARTGPLKLLDGALEIVLREGIVNQILIHREFALPGD